MTYKHAHLNRRRRINGFAGVQYLFMGEMFCRRFAFGGHTDRQDGRFGRIFVMLNDRIRDAPILERLRREWPLRCSRVREPHSGTAL
jgi:hypothetical protein